MRLNLIFIGIILIGLGFFSLQIHTIKKLKVERSRLSNNQAVLLGELEEYSVADSLKAVSIRSLNFELSDLRRFRSRDLELIKELNVDIKRINRITKTSSKSVYEIKTLTKIIPETLGTSELTPVDSLRSIQYKTPWIELDAVVDSYGVFMGTIICLDSIVYVEHIVPRKFLFFKWGIKEKRQEIVSLNPHTRILSAEFIQIQD